MVSITCTIEPDHAVVELAKSAAAGNRDAFGELYKRYARMVHAVTLSYVSWTQAEDVMQDVFASALEHISQLRDARTFGAWLRGIARNRAVDYARRDRGTTELRDDMARTRPAPPEAFGVLAAMRELPEAYRDTLMMRLVEGMTGPEIAERTGLTPESVRVNLCRGMKLLREKLEGGAR